jgi:hypothetical protein
LCASVGIINSVLDTIEARCKHEEGRNHIFSIITIIRKKQMIVG